MSEIPDVIGGETITSAGYNTRTDRTVQRYASAVARDASILVPVDGDMAFLQDIGAVTFFASGWHTMFTLNGGTIAGPVAAATLACTTDGSPGAPAFHFSDTDSGLYQPTNDAIAITTAGSQRVLVTPTAFIAKAVQEQTAGAPANVYVDGNGQLFRSTV